jgi:hypothetical protein
MIYPFDAVRHIQATQPAQAGKCYEINNIQVRKYVSIGTVSEIESISIMLQCLKQKVMKSAETPLLGT